MNPASATSRGEKRSTSAASAASKASRLPKPRCSTTRVAMPRAAAISSPLASARLLITALTGSRASSSACRLLPRPEISVTIKSDHPVRTVAVRLEQREHAFPAVKVQRAEGDESAAAAQIALHAKRHHHAAVVQHALGHHRLMRGDARMARDEILAQPPDRREVMGEIGLERALSKSDELRAMREAVLEQR